PAVLFKTGSAVIDPRFTNLLDSVIASLSRYQIKSLEVIGHTDNTGAYAQNLVLSRNRAKSVLDYITHKMGLVKVSYTGRADEVPVATNETVGGRSANRRVELIISYTTAP
ncbi:MAG: OmpA family protein, partial [Chitinophagaceae bacterium]